MGPESLLNFFAEAQFLDARALAPEDSDAKKLVLDLNDLNEKLISLDLDDFENKGAESVRKAMKGISISENPELLNQVFNFIDQLIATYDLCEDAFENNASPARKSNLNDALVLTYRMFDLSLVVLDELYKQINDSQQELIQEFQTSLAKIKRNLIDFYVDEAGRPPETRKFFANLDFAKKYFPNN
jgi:hypothetical protein